MDECTFTSAELDVRGSLIAALELEEWECSRPAWNERDETGDRCVWHAEVADKPPDRLENNTKTGDLHSAIVPSGTDLSDFPLPNELGFIDADLSGVILDGADLSGAILTDADLSGASLADADLSRAVLRDADLPKARLVAADLPDAHLIDADLLEADLRNTDLSGALLTSADLPGADLRNADLSGAVLSHADLSGAFLSDTDLSEADLRDANLTGATVERGLLSRVNLFDTYLAGAGLNGTVLGNIQINETTFKRLASEQEPLEGANNSLKRLKTVLAGPTGDDSLRCVYDPDSPYTLPQPPRTSDLKTGDDPEVQAAEVYQKFERLARDNAFPEWRRKFLYLRRICKSARKPA